MVVEKYWKNPVDIVDGVVGVVKAVEVVKVVKVVEVVEGEEVIFCCRDEAGGKRKDSGK